MGEAYRKCQRREFLETSSQKPVRKRPLGRRRRRWEANIKKDIIQRGRESVGWIQLAYNTDKRILLNMTVKFGFHKALRIC